MSLLRTLSSLALLLGAGSVAASAATLYSSFGSEYESFDGWSVMNTSFFFRTAAMGFTVASPSTLDEIDVAYLSGEPSTLTFTLYSSSAMDDASALRSWNIDVTNQFRQILKLEAGSTPTLLSTGTTYWLLAATSNGSGTWLNGLPSVVGDVYTSEGSSSGMFSGPQGAFQVLGDTATPEPSAAVLLLGGLGALGGLRLRRRASLPR